MALLEANRTPVVVFLRQCCRQVSRFATMSDIEPFKQRQAGCGAVLRYLKETDSTNREARAWALEGAPDGAVVVTDHQRAGRGRFERTWESAPGQNLLLTIVLRRGLPRPALLPLASGVAVRDTVAGLAAAGTVGLKWPNDVRINGRKVAGILVESPEKGVYLVGIGLNVNQVDFPQAMANEPTSLKLETGRHVDRGEVFDRLMQELDAALEKLQQGTVLAAYRPHLEGKGQPVVLQDGRSGVLEGVDDSGGLVLRTESGLIVVHSGDVSLRPPHDA